MAVRADVRVNALQRVSGRYGALPSNVVQAAFGAAPRFVIPSQLEVDANAFPRGIARYRSPLVRLIFVPCHVASLNETRFHASQRAAMTFHAPKREHCIHSNWLRNHAWSRAVTRQHASPRVVTHGNRLPRVSIRLRPLSRSVTCECILRRSFTRRPVLLLVEMNAPHGNAQ